MWPMALTQESMNRCDYIIELMKIQKAQWDFLQKLNHGTLNDISYTFDSL
jgi:hypothetical protein